MVKIIRKKRKGIKIEHNKKLFWIIVILLIFLIILIWLIVRDGKRTYYFLDDNKCVMVREYPDKITFSHYEELEDCERLVIKECFSDADCVASECCHAFSCVHVSNSPDCSGMFCTMECAPGTMDCGQGRCECVDGMCEAIFI